MEKKSLSMLLMLVCFVGGVVAFMGLMGSDLGAGADWAPPQLSSITGAPWFRTALWVVVGAAAIAVLVTGIQVVLGRRRKPVRAGSIVRRDELNVHPDAPLAHLPAYRDKLVELCGVKTPSAIEIVNHLLSTGLSLGASDIHLAPGQSGTRATLRVHGLLYDLGTLPPDLHPPMVSRIKVVSDLAIFRKNTPQDGRIRLEDESYTARVSVLPTNHGEKVVMRLASQHGGLYALDRLGLDEEMLSLYKALLNRNQGVIIMTGPTGSGKTTTMYASLLHIDSTRGQSVNIVTLEDPIEFDFPQFSQTQIEVDAGLTFAVGLRSMLRQDPDVMMVGEIRDEETASNAMRAAMTGHLIFSTVHADSTAGVWGRLVQIGIEPTHLASAVCAVMAQRLCQRICPHCRTQAPVSDTQRRQLGLLGLDQAIQGPFYIGRGCDQCLGMGFTGLTALYEMMIVTNPIRDAIMRGEAAYKIYGTAVEGGMSTLLDCGLKKARRGEVSLDEVLRVVTL